MSLIVTSVRLCARTSGASDVTRDNGEEDATDGLVNVVHGESPRQYAYSYRP